MRTYKHRFNRSAWDGADTQNNHRMEPERTGSGSSGTNVQCYLPGRSAGANAQWPTREQKENHGRLAGSNGPLAGRLIKEYGSTPPPARRIWNSLEGKPVSGAAGRPRGPPQRRPTCHNSPQMRKRHGIGTRIEV